MLGKTNTTAVLLASVAGMVIGFLWYGALFQEQWMAGNGITQSGDQMFRDGKPMDMSPLPMILNFLSMLVYALILNWMQNSMGVSTWQGGAKVGAAVGLMASLTSILGHLFAGDPSTLSLVDGSYLLVLFTVIGAVVGGWRRR